MSDYPEPPPIDYNDWGPPPDEYDYGLDFDPYPPVLDTWIPDDKTAVIPDVPPLSQDGLQGFEPPEPLDEGWGWHDARFIGVERETEAGTRFEIGAMDVYANLDTGDLGGSYLPVASFEDIDVATAFYHNLQREVYAQNLPPHQLPEFAEQQAAALNPETVSWRGAAPEEYAAYQLLADLNSVDPTQTDEMPAAALDPLLQTAAELGGVVTEREMQGAFQLLAGSTDALAAIGVQTDHIDPPPFYDAETGTAYWIGVFQPDQADRENCVTSILSLGRDPQTDQLEAQLAPCVPGDWDKAYASAEYLIQIAQKGGIEQVFDIAEGMALATDQRALWETERGLPLEPETTREIADYTRDTWKVDL